MYVHFVGALLVVFSGPGADMNCPGYQMIAGRGQRRWIQ